MRRKKVKGVFKYLVLFSLTVFAVWYWQTRMVELPVRVEVPAPVVTVIRAERGGPGAGALLSGVCRGREHGDRAASGRRAA